MVTFFLLFDKICRKLSKQKSVDDIFGESSVTKVKDWWLTLVDDHSEDEF